MERTPMTRGRFPWIRGVAVLAIGMLAAGAFAISPATAGKFLTKKKADNRFVNVGEKATDADKLDGQDSAAFLGATAKAADSEQLDGRDSATFLSAGSSARDAVNPTPDEVLSTTLETVMSTQVTTTATAGRLSVAAAATLVTTAATASEGQCRVLFDVGPLGIVKADTPATMGYDVTLPVVASVDVGPGTHTIAIECAASAGSLAFDRGSLAAWAS